MPRIGRQLFLLAYVGWAALAGPLDAAPTEYNPVRRIPVTLGPEAYRLIVGFRATPANSVTDTVTFRRRQRSFSYTHAQTVPATARALAERTGVAVAITRQITPSMHVLFLPKTLYGADVAGVLAKLRADPAVEFAVVDKRRYALGAVTPNDPLFPAS